MRKWQKAAYTIGVLSLDGVRLCNILEPPCNGYHHGVTAIPKGTYEIDMTIVSPKYKERVWSKPYGGIVPTLNGYGTVVGTRVNANGVNINRNYPSRLWSASGTPYNADYTNKGRCKNTSL